MKKSKDWNTLIKLLILINRRLEERLDPILQPIQDFSHIRDLLSQTVESRSRGYKPGRFSFNVKGGRCEACQGDGMIKVEMHFLQMFMLNVIFVVVKDITSKLLK